MAAITPCVKRQAAGKKNVRERERKKKLEVKKYSILQSHHFAGLLCEMEGVREDINICRSLQFVATVSGYIELDMVALKQRHFGLGVLLSK